MVGRNATNDETIATSDRMDETIATSDRMDETNEDDDWNKFRETMTISRTCSLV